MIQGSGGVANYANFSRNCTLNQSKYQIPINNLADVQLYVDIGTVKPTTILIELIHTCGPTGGTVDVLAAGTYIVGQDTNGRWYGVFKGLTGGSGPSCFVIAITLDSTIWFSEEYCIEPSCHPLVNLRGCYGNLDGKISYYADGVYFGTHQGPDTALGDETVVYTFQAKMREVDVRLNSIKNTFKSGRTRNFRTEKERIYLFWADFVPEWYLINGVDPIFTRGEVFVGDTRYMVNATVYEPIEDCKKLWRPAVQLKDSYYQSFSCEADPCQGPAAVPEICCDPLGVSASVVDFVCCDPEVISADVEDSGGS